MIPAPRRKHRATGLPVGRPKGSKDKVPRKTNIRGGRTVVGEGTKIVKFSRPRTTTVVGIEPANLAAYLHSRAYPLIVVSDPKTHNTGAIEGKISNIGGRYKNVRDVVTLEEWLADLED